MKWLIPRDGLTEDQLNAVLMSRQQNQLVIGGPGSGKTLVLVHRAKDFVLNGVPPEKIKILVYTKVLVQYLEGAVSVVGLPSGIVSTFDSWAMMAHRQFAQGKSAVVKGNGLDYDLMREQVLESLVALNPEPWLDAVLVDEGQDLSPVAIKILKRASKHVTLACDIKQQLYQHDFQIDQVCKILDVPRASATLLSSYRCTQLIVDMAACFIPDKDEADQFRRATLLPIEGIETPVLYEPIDQDDEISTMANLLKERAQLGQKSAVLVTSKSEIFKIAAKLEKLGLSVTRQDSPDFNDLRPLICTFHSAKGLTVDCVFLPQLTNDKFDKMHESLDRNALLFVGITRAARWVWLSANKNDALVDLNQLKPIENTGTFFRQRAKPLTTAPSSAPTSAGITVTDRQVHIIRPAVKKAATLIRVGPNADGTRRTPAKKVPLKKITVLNRTQRNISNQNLDDLL